MSLRRTTFATTLRATVREHLLARGYQRAARTCSSVELDYVVRLRGELSGGRDGLFRMLAPATAVELLGDAEAVLGYVEALAAEAAIRRAGGDDAGASALEQRALALALAARPAVPAGDLERECDDLVAALRSRSDDVGGRGTAP